MMFGAVKAVQRNTRGAGQQRMEMLQPSTLAPPSRAAPSHQRLCGVGGGKG